MGVCGWVRLITNTFYLGLGLGLGFGLGLGLGIPSGWGYTRVKKYDA